MHNRYCLHKQRIYCLSKTSAKVRLKSKTAKLLMFYSSFFDVFLLYINF